MESWDYELSPELAAVRPAAARFRAWAAQRVNEAAAADFELALVEACNNLIVHNPSARGLISLSAEATLSELTLLIRDTTVGFEWPREIKLPDTDAESGRGIFLMRALMTQVEYLRGPHGNELRLRQKL